MTEKYSDRIYIVYICTVFIISASVALAGINKPDFHSIYKSDSGTTYNSAFFEQNVTWNEADVTCKLYFGYLLSELPENSTLYSELVKKGVDVLWVGIRRKAGYYIKQQEATTYPRLFRETKPSSARKLSEPSIIFGKQWLPGDDLLYDCVALILESGKLMTQPCGLSFPFVCESKGKLREHKDDCPESWALNVPLSIKGRKCISEIHAFPFYNEAENFCSGYESRLASKHEYEILNSRNQLQLIKGVGEFWAHKEDDISCTYKVSHIGVNTSNHECPTNGSKRLPFYCIKSMETEVVDVILEVGSTRNSVEPYQIFPGNSTCDTKDIIICNVKNYPAKSTLYQWFRDGIPIDWSAYACRLSFLSTALKWKIDGHDHRAKQGSYHCEVRFPGEVKTHSSEKIDYFYSDSATYVIDFHNVKRESCVDYSHSNFEKVMNRINKAINKIPSMKNSTWDFKSVRKTKESCSLKLVLFINRTIDYNDERAYKNLTSSFENASFPLGKNISLSVHSADVCFAGDLSSRDTCDEIKWPTTKQAKNVPSESVCLNEHKKFVHRECKGSIINKAEWSAFDCSKCKDLKRKRYQDQPVPCPDGYNKFKNQDICFKIYHEKKNWHDAYKTCSEISSYMLDVPFENEIDNITSLWLSYKYSYGQIQGFGKKPIEQKILDEKREILLENINNRSHELHCISAVRDESGFHFKFENCSLEMSFVCVRRLYELVSSAKFASTWIKLYKENNIESCYYTENSPYNRMEAANFCKQTFYGAKLLNGALDMYSYSYLKKLIIDQQFNETQCDAVTWWINLDDVIQHGMPPNLTYVDWGPTADFNMQDPHGVIALFPDKKIYWSLEKSHKKLGAICEIEKCSDKRPPHAYIERRSLFNANGSEDALGWLKTFYFKCIPSGWFIADSITWYKDDILLSVISDELSVYNISSMTYPKALEYQGYYSCSVDKVEKKETIYSSKHLVRIPGFYTLVLSMTTVAETHLNDCRKYILSNALYENSTLYECVKENWKNYITFNYSHFLLKNLKCHRSHIDITIHVYFKDDLPEDEMLENVRRSDFSDFCKACNIVPENITAQSTVLCHSDEVRLKNSVLRWPTTELGKSSFPDKICLTDDSKLIERRCIGDFNTGAFWSNISITECKYTDSTVTRELQNLLNSRKVVNPLPYLPNITSNSEQLQPSDVQLTVEILRYIADNEELLPCDNLSQVVKTVRNMAAINPKVLMQAANSSNQIVGYLERIASNVYEEYCDKTIDLENIHVNVCPLNSDDPEVQNGIYISNSATTEIFNGSVEVLLGNMQNFQAGVVVPKSLLQKMSNASDRVVYTVMPNFNFKENISVLSNVISVTLHNVPVYDLGREEVTLLFKLNSKIDNIKKVMCVFWDDNIEDYSYKGCFLRNSSEGSVLCGCNHLTSFTVIMMESVPPAHEEPLKYITYIGCSLSCIGFGMIMLTFLCFREWRKSLKNKCLFNFSLSHFLFLVIYMAGIDKTGSVWCKITAIFLHYFLLSSFAWMIVLAYTVYLSLVKVFATYIPQLIQKAIAFAWGVPTIIVVLVLSAKHELYPGDKLCWLSNDVVTYAIMIPLILMLSINYIIFGTIFYLNTCGSKYVTCNQEKQKLVIARAKALLITSILLGLSWIFGFFILGTEKETQIFFMYLFTITTTFQGFLLAVFFIIRPKGTRQLWIKLLLPSTDAVKSHTSHINSTSIANQDQNKIENRYENMVYGVVFKARTPYSPYT